MGPGTQDSGPGRHTWDAGYRNLHLGPFTLALGPLRETRDLGPFTWDPICWTLEETHFVYLPQIGFI